MVVLRQVLLVHYVGAACSMWWFLLYLNTKNSHKFLKQGISLILMYLLFVILNLLARKQEDNG